MRILFVHQNFPAQYAHVARALAARPDCEVVALAMTEKSPIPGVRVVTHAVSRGSTPTIHPLASDFETKVLRGESAARAALALRAEGFRPDVICGHPGWGETLFLKDVWPDAKLLTFVEFSYNAVGGDVNFDPEFPLGGDEARFGIRVKNAAGYLALSASDWLVSPTRWQARQLPQEYAGRLSVIHDGIDTEVVRPDPRATVSLGRDGLVLRPGDEVVTFVNRNLEPYRGYHSFIRALPEILRRRPRARAILVGGNGVSFGARPADRRTYRDIYLDEVKADLDLSRVHFVGQVPFKTYVNLLQVSAAHVYLTYPFVLSWSLLESMAAGCAVIGSATPPVEEVIRDRQNGVLVDFFSPAAISEAVVDALAKPHAHRALRQAARRTAEGYDLKKVCLPRQVRLIEQVAAGEFPVAG
ncbi:glycosyltransferase [Methylobacterium trifolii]